MNSKLLTAEQLRSMRTKAETMVLKCMSIDSKPAGSEVLPLLDHIDTLEQRIQQLEGTLSLYGDEDNWECGYDGEWTLTGLAGGPAAAAKELTQ